MVPLMAQTRGSALTYLTLDAAPQDVGLSGASGALGGRTDGMLINPSLLSLPYYSPQAVPMSVYFSSRPFFFDEFRNNILFLRFPGYGFDMGAYAQIVSTDDLQILDDLGDRQGTAPVSFFSGGLGFSYRFPGKERFFVVGTNLKGWQSRLGDFSAAGFAADLSGMFYFRMPRPNFMRYVTDMPDSALAVVVHNLGTPAKFFQESEPAPLSYSVSHYVGLYAFKMNQFDFFHGFHHYVQLGGMRYSAGLEYKLFSIIAFRAGVSYNLQHYSTGGVTAFSGGVGLRDKRNENFGYSLDYAMAQSPLDGASHMFGAGFTYYLPKPEEVRKVNPGLDLEIIAEAQRVVRDVKQKKGRVPASLAELYQEMKERGYPEPRLTAGRIVYLPEVEQVVYVKYSDNDEKVYLITLRDGSALLGNIVHSDDNKVELLSSAGLVQIPTREIAKIVSSEFRQIDDVAKLRTQYLVLEFRKLEGRLPDSLNELRDYSAKKGWIIPKAIASELTYNPATGEVQLQPLSGGNTTPVEQPKGVEDTNSSAPGTPEVPIDPTPVIDPLGSDPAPAEKPAKEKTDSILPGN